jgi:DNA-binding CsgD family transcriptional regulator
MEGGSFARIGLLVEGQARGREGAGATARLTAPHLSSTCRRLHGTIHLTRRELQVLALLAEGLPNKLICRRLDISGGTVKIHVSRVLAELGVSSRLQAVVVAQRLGLLGTTSSTGQQENPVGSWQLEEAAQDRARPGLA